MRLIVTVPYAGVRQAIKALGRQSRPFLTASDLDKSAPRIWPDHVDDSEAWDPLVRAALSELEQPATASSPILVLTGPYVERLLSHIGAVWLPQAGLLNENLAKARRLQRAMAHPTPADLRLFRQRAQHLADARGISPSATLRDALNLLKRS